MLNRRLFLGLMAMLPRGQGAPAPPRSPLDPPAPSPSLARLTTSYRVDATILLLGLPIFSRPGVGGGYAIVEDFPNSRSLQFAAGSIPERARGLNRLGFIHEVSSPTGSRYFGFMSSSPEESFRDARRALEVPGAPETPYTAISGAVGSGAAQSRVCRFTFPARLSWSDWDLLLPAAASAFQDASNTQPESSRACPDSLRESFLAALHRALRAGPGRVSLPFAYGARDLTLRALISPQNQSGLLLLRGKTLAGSKTLSSFNLWFRPGSPIPQKIELQARSYLRLVLHAIPSGE